MPAPKPPKKPHPAVASPKGALKADAVKSVEKTITRHPEDAVSVIRKWMGKKGEG